MKPAGDSLFCFVTGHQQSSRRPSASCFIRSHWPVENVSLYSEDLKNVLYILFPSVVSCLDGLPVEFKVQQNLFCCCFCPLAVATDDHFSIVIFALVNIWDRGCLSFKPCKFHIPSRLAPCQLRRYRSRKIYDCCRLYRSYVFHLFTWFHFLTFKLAGRPMAFVAIFIVLWKLLLAFILLVWTSVKI